jgi:hypothetical protein
MQGHLKFIALGDSFSSKRVSAMSADEMIQAKIGRLEELRKYQAYYGPNTPYPVVLEINDLEIELRRQLGAQSTRPTRAVKKSAKKKGVSFWKMSQATFDAIATIAFIGLVFLLGAIVFAAYKQTRPEAALARMGAVEPGAPPPPALRPTFTPTPPAGLPGADVAALGVSHLPPANQPPTAVPTLVPTITPSITRAPTEPPPPTATPVPPPAPPSPPTATPAPPPPTPEPSFPFTMVEQGNRMFQKTTYHVITIYVAVVSAGNVPIGGLKVVGDHVPSGAHTESGLSDWNWSVVNCLGCDYVKFGNVKLEPGTFSDGVWNIYLADPNGVPLSAVTSLSYAADPAQWVWDFVIFRQK